jgi:hypothetical protein
VHGFLNLDHVSPAAAVADDDLLREFGDLILQGSESQRAV